MSRPAELLVPPARDSARVNLVAQEQRAGDTSRMDPQVVRYSERPELWDGLGELFDGVWPEYNLHGGELNHYWSQLYDVFPEWQFMLIDPEDQTVLAEGHTVPVAWDGTDEDLGPGIDATIAVEMPPRRLVSRPSGALRSSAVMRQISRQLSCRIRANSLNAWAGRGAASRDRPANHADAVYHGKIVVPAHLCAGREGEPIIDMLSESNGAAFAAPSSFRI